MRILLAGATGAIGRPLIRVTAGQLRSVLAGGRVARPPCFSDRQKLNEKAAPGLGRNPFSCTYCLKKRSDREFAPLQGRTLQSSK